MLLMIGFCSNLKLPIIMGYYDAFLIMSGWGGLVDEVRTYYAQETKEKELFKYLLCLNNNSEKQSIWTVSKKLQI